MIITSEKEIPGCEIVEYLGTVRAEGNRRMDTAPEQLRDQIIEDITLEANGLDADAVVEIFHYQNPNPGDVETLIESIRPVVYGRAVRLK